MNEAIQMYKDLREKINCLEEDIKYTTRALNDPKLDYLTKREYKNDLIMDRQELHVANAQLGQLINFMCEYGIIS